VHECGNSESNIYRYHARGEGGHCATCRHTTEPINRIGIHPVSPKILLISHSNEGRKLSWLYYAAVYSNKYPEFVCYQKPCGVLTCRQGDGDHVAVGKPQQLYKPVDLHGVQRPPTTSSGSLLSLWSAGARPGD